MAKAVKKVAAQAQTKLAERAVARFTVPEMREVAGTFGWTLKGLRREDITAQMRDFYLSDEGVAQALGTLSGDERRLLALCAWVGWSDPPQLLNAIRALLSILPKGWVASGVNAKLIDRFVERGLLLRVNEGQHPQVGVLDSFARHLLPIPELLSAPDGAARLRPTPPGDPLASLLLAWYTVQGAAPVTPVSPFPSGVIHHNNGQWPIKPTDQTGNYWNATTIVPIYAVSSPLPPPLLNTLQESLDKRDTGRAAFFVALLQALGLMRVQGVSLQLNSDALQTFLAQPSDVQWKRLVEGWQGMGYGLWDEYSGVQQAHPEVRLYRRPTVWQLQPATFSQQLTSMRAVLFNVLRWLPSERGKEAGWVGSQSLARLLWATHPFAIAPPLRTGGWYMGDALQQVFDPEKWDQWQRSSQHVLTYVLDGPLRWLGLVETAQDNQGQLLAVRLTPIGAALLQDAPLPKQKGAAPEWQAGLAVAVQPNAAALPLVALLATVAANEGMEQGALRFRFTPEAAHAAFEAGKLPPDLRADFARLGAPLPDEASQALERWWQRWGLIHQYDELALIELADELLVRELLTATSLGQFVVFRCSPTALALPAEAVDQVVRELEKKGYLPRVIHD